MKIFVLDGNYEIEEFRERNPFFIDWFCVVRVVDPLRPYRLNDICPKSEINQVDLLRPSEKFPWGRKNGQKVWWILMLRELVAAEGVPISPHEIRATERKLNYFYKLSLNVKVKPV